MAQDTLLEYTVTVNSLSQSPGIVLRATGVQIFGGKKGQFANRHFFRVNSRFVLKPTIC